MKRIGHVLILLAAVCTLSGCASSGVELTNEQNDMVAEYIAGALLRYDMRYEEKLLYSTDEEATESEPTQPEASVAPPSSSPAQETSDPQGQTPDSQLVSGSLTEVIGTEGVELKYKESAFYDSYPEDSSLVVIEPGLSNKLLVAEFQIANTSSQKQKIDLSSLGIKYLLKIGEKEYSPLLTALPNDLRYLSTTLAGGKSRNVIVIFKVEKDTELKNAQLIVTRDHIAANISPM